MEDAAVPIVDVEPLRNGCQADRQRVADLIGAACRDNGFFYIVGHGVPSTIIERLDQLSREFFALPREEKMAIRMELGGRAWRGYFPVGDELTKGLPDQKEGIYFGSELPLDHPKVLTKTPLHGGNLFPDVAGFRDAVFDYIDEMTSLGHVLMEGIALSLQLEATYFANRYTSDPLVLFRIFHYPSLFADTDSNHETKEIETKEIETKELWSVGEHTDYGLLTILRQDESGGLQIKSQSKWIDAPPIAGSLICNIGDMLDRMTGGVFRSTPHRVKNSSRKARLSFPFFFDPNFDVEIEPIRSHSVDDALQRWDGESVHEFSGSYGDYVMKKVSRVFPDLGTDQLR
ncbi:MAG: isopenicillin N synthase-like dioxygenase [Pirellulaceae bacterium]|jgi:isopenicillin N synthase-like dioxygenase